MPRRWPGHLGLPVARVRLATVVSSYLGETARNLDQIFSFLDVGSWVLIFDEFDMLGRSVNSEHIADAVDLGEARRQIVRRSLDNPRASTGARHSYRFGTVFAHFAQF